MGSLSDGAVVLWSMPQFWVAVPAIMLVLLFGSSVLLAVLKARREDIPTVLDILGDIVGRRERRPKQKGGRS